jgi:hypothetical protein
MRFKVLTDDWEGGETLDKSLKQYQGVSRGLATSASEEARRSLVSQLR